MDRREPTISAIRPEQDEIRKKQRQTQRNTATQTRPGTAQAQPVVVKSSLTPFAFLIAITALGLAGFAYWQLTTLQKTLVKTEAALVQAEARINSLEGQLELSGDESVASTAAIQAKLKWADSEIRKLWGVSHDTNRKAIKANKDGIASVAKRLTETKKSGESKMNSVLADVKVASELVEAQQESIVAIEKADLQQATQVQGLVDRLNQTERLNSDLKQRIENNEQAIEAIDAFRRSVNRDLLQLKSGGSAQ